MQARFARLRHGYYDEVVRGSRVQEYLHELLTSRHSASEVRIFSLAEHFVGSFLRFANAQIDVFWKYERMILNVDIWLNLLSLAGTAAIWMFAVFQAVAGQITVGDLTLVLPHPFNAAHGLTDSCRRSAMSSKESLARRATSGLSNSIRSLSRGRWRPVVIQPGAFPGP